MPVDTIPLELYATILGYVEDDVHALKSASLVCRDWSTFAQMVLFSHIKLGRTPAYTLNPTTAIKLFSSSPHLVTYVKHVHVSANYIYRDPALPDLLDSLTQLRGFSFHALLDWNDLPFDLRRAITTLLQLPSLVDVRLFRISKVPISVLNNSFALNRLTLWLSSFVPGDEPVVSSNKVAIQSLRVFGIPPATSDYSTANLFALQGSNLDFSDLRLLSFEDNPKRPCDYFNFSQDTARLQRFSLKIHSGTPFESSSSSLFFDLSRLPDLQSIDFAIYGGDPSASDLDRIYRSLHTISSQNSQKIEIVLQIKVSNAGVSSKWEQLDRLLSNGRWRICLESFTLCVNFGGWEGLSPVLDSAYRDQYFPILNSRGLFHMI